MSAVSGSDAWAVGNYHVNHTHAHDALILHWNGTAWTQVASPNPSRTENELRGISAVSGSDAWAVGDYVNHSTGATDTLILHWNGAGWTQVASPNPSSTDSELYGVSADSGSDAWAVGYYRNTATGTDNALILHWNGAGWTQVASPFSGTTSSSLSGTSAVSGSDAWAVGDYVNTTGATETLILRWNGAAWTQVASPSPSAGDNELNGVSADSPADAWAAGQYFKHSRTSTLILRWNGTTWAKVYSPNPSSFSNSLYGVSAVSGSDAWAVGAYNNNATRAVDTLILHWNGTAWTKVYSPHPSSAYNSLAAVSADLGSDAWAVGQHYHAATGATDTLILRWNGTAWTRL